MPPSGHVHERGTAFKVINYLINTICVSSVGQPMLVRAKLGFRIGFFSLPYCQLVMRIFLLLNGRMPLRMYIIPRCSAVPAVGSYEFSFSAVREGKD